MVGTLACPIVVVVALIIYRKWITEKLGSLRLKAGSLEAEVRTLNQKVDTIGKDVALTLSEVPRPATDGRVPESLVDLMALVNRNRSEGIHAAFELVRKALKDAYPQLRRVPPAQLPEAMKALVDKGLMDADVEQSVRHLYELLEMPEWNQDQVGDTRGYAFLMLAEGAIHGILRSAHQRAVARSGEQPGATEAQISPAWRGTYNDSYRLEVRIRRWEDLGFSGDMAYPDSDTVTSVRGRIDEAADGAGTRVIWTETGYSHKGRRDIDFRGSYSATVTGDLMDGGWYR
jgi:hypothetical protein